MRRLFLMIKSQDFSSGSNFSTRTWWFLRSCSSFFVFSIIKFPFSAVCMNDFSMWATHHSLIYVSFVHEASSGQQSRDLKGKRVSFSSRHGSVLVGQAVSVRPCWCLQATWPPSAPQRHSEQDTEGEALTGKFSGKSCTGQKEDKLIRCVRLVCVWGGGYRGW